jgi:hypothetical protein
MNVCQTDCRIVPRTVAGFSVGLPNLRPAGLSWDMDSYSIEADGNGGFQFVVLDAAFWGGRRVVGTFPTFDLAQEWVNAQTEGAVSLRTPRTWPDGRFIVEPFRRGPSQTGAPMRTERACLDSRLPVKGPTGTGARWTAKTCGTLASRA